jgi:hypothetical protein
MSRARDSIASAVSSGPSAPSERRRNTAVPSGAATDSRAWKIHASSLRVFGSACRLTRISVTSHSRPVRRARPSIMTSGQCGSGATGSSSPWTSATVMGFPPQGMRFHTIGGLSSSLRLSLRPRSYRPQAAVTASLVASPATQNVRPKEDGNSVAFGGASGSGSPSSVGASPPTARASDCSGAVLVWPGASIPTRYRSLTRDFATSSSGPPAGPNRSSRISRSSSARIADAEGCVSACEPCSVSVKPLLLPEYPSSSNSVRLRCDTARRPRPLRVSRRHQAGLSPRGNRVLGGPCRTSRRRCLGLGRRDQRVLGLPVAAVPVRSTRPCLG